MALAVTLLTMSPLVLYAWLLPLLLVAEPCHFLIELPEHFGLNTHDSTDVLVNTRTVRASRIAQWFTNFNNLHAAHHYHPGVPMARAGELNELLSSSYRVVETSYFSFYIKVIHGEIRHDDLGKTCVDQ